VSVANVCPSVLRGLPGTSLLKTWLSSPTSRTRSNSYWALCSRPRTRGDLHQVSSASPPPGRSTMTTWWSCSSSLCNLYLFCLVNPGLLGHGPGMNNMNLHMQMPMNGGYPPNNPPGGPRFNHPPPPHNHGPPINSGGGPRMMGPPPGQGRGVDNGNYWGDDSMRGGPPRGGHFHRGGRGRGGEPGFRGRGRGGPRGGHNNMNGMWDRGLWSAAKCWNELPSSIITLMLSVLDYL